MMRSLHLFYAVLFGILLALPIGYAADANGTLNVILTNNDLFLNNVESVHVEIVRIEEAAETVVWESEETLPVDISLSTSPGIYRVYVRKDRSTVLEYNNDSTGYVLFSGGEITIPAQSSGGEIGILFQNTVDTDVLSDAPWRLEPDRSIPITHIIKDTDEYSLYIRNIEIYNDDPPLEDGAGDTLVYIHTLEQTFSQDFWYDIDYLSPSLFSDGDTYSGLEIHAKYDIAGELDVHKYFTVNVDSDPLPTLGNWYAGDTHYHSNYTDNNVEFGGPVEATVASGKAIGLDWVTITDHSFDLDPTKWSNLGTECTSYSDGSFKCIRGEEISVYLGGNPSCLPIPPQYNHYLAYGISTYITGGECADGTGSDYSPSEVVSMVNSQIGGFGYVAHPMASDPFRDQWQDYSLDFTGLQVWNYPDYVNDPQELQDGLTKWTELLRNGRHVFMVVS